VGAFALELDEKFRALDRMKEAGTRPPTKDDYYLDGWL